MNSYQTSHPPVAIEFLCGGGEMGQLTRAFPWETTSVGPPDQWPQSLRTILSVILNSRFPMFLWWGPDLICFYNDAYRPSLGQNGKHPSILGQPAEEAWAEIWHVIKPLIDQALTGTAPTLAEDQLIPIYRNGKIEDVYWTFSYSPVNDETNKPAGVLVTCTETTEKVNNLVQLQESKDQLAFAIEAAGLGTWDYNPITGRFSSNDRLKEWFGFETTQEVDLALAIEAIAEEDRLRVQIERATEYSSGGHYDIQYTIVNKRTGLKRTVRARGMARFNEAKQAFRFNGTLQDVTEQLLSQKEHEQKLEALVAQRTADLERSNEDLEQFAHVASHDLKEPVRKIKLFANRMEEELKDVLPERGRAYLEKIQRAAGRMLTMVEGVLAYSSHDRARVPIEKVDLQAILTDIKTDLDMLFHQKRAQLFYQDLPELEGAGVLIYQLFYNLINNSLKFVRPDEPLEIHITGAKQTIGNKEWVKIKISDNGMGFKQEYALRIFESFVRLHPKDKFEGTGLGLALCKKIVLRHQGMIEAHGELNKGATFEVTLPVLQTGRSI